jgi:uncharacterized protein (DUF1778 family)
MSVHCTYVKSLVYIQRGANMPAAASKKRSQRFNVRASDREARLIRLGAERRGVNITSFILESACVRADRRSPTRALSNSVRKSERLAKVQ